MDTKNDYTPKRRFPGFEGEWEQKKLGDIVEINSGKDYKHLIEGDVPVYGTGGYMLSVSEALSFRDGIGIGRKGTIDKPYILRAPFWTVDTLFYCVPKEKDDLQFVNAIFERINWRSYDESTGVPSLSKVIINNIQVFSSCIDEQRTVGDFLLKVEKQISLHQHKLDKLKDMKQAYLTEMFPVEGERVPKRRFPGFEGEWEWKKLGELATIVRGASPRPIQDPKWFDSESEVGWLRISDVTEQNGRIYKLSQRLSSLGQEKTRVVSEPHLILSIAATVGKPVINYVRTGIHDGFLIFQEPKFEIEYMYYLLGMFRKNWASYGQPGSQLNLNSDIVKEQRVAIPSQSEQVEISKFFNKLDQSISLQQQKLDKLNDLKKAYLNELFV